VKPALAMLIRLEDGSHDIGPVVGKGRYCENRLVVVSSRWWNTMPVA
jgi:hypothetical protein